MTLDDQIAAAKGGEPIARSGKRETLVVWRPPMLRGEIAIVTGGDLAKRFYVTTNGALPADLVALVGGKVASDWGKVSELRGG